MQKEWGSNSSGSSRDSADYQELQDALVRTDNVEQFLHQVAVLAARVVDGGHSCGMAVAPNGRGVTVACSDPVASQVDGLQYELDDGPGLQALRDGRMVSVADTTAQRQWPKFEAEAAAKGILSCLALPLTSGGQSIGALNFYADTPAAFGPDEEARAESLAAGAAGALTLATRLASYSALIEQLRSSLHSRTIIDQALGVIMAREHCTQARAFAILRSASQNSNLKVRDIAAAIVTSVTGEAPQPPPPFEHSQG